MKDYCNGKIWSLQNNGDPGKAHHASVTSAKYEAVPQTILNDQVDYYTK